MRTTLSRSVLRTALGIGLCAATATLARAQDYRYVPQGPVYARPGSSFPYPVVSSPAAAGTPLPATAQPDVPLAVQAPLPPSAPPPAEPSTQQTPQAPQAPQEGQQQAGQQGQQPQTNPEGNANAPAGAEAGAGEAGLGAVGAESSTGFLGRGDADNRFNLFDNNSAFPTNRVWYTYEFLQNFRTGVREGAPGESPIVSEDFGRRRDENLSRIGVEFAPTRRFSVAFQDQYVASADTPDKADAWANPEIMLKYAFVLDCDFAVAATFGIQPQTASHDGELHEKDTRFLPGVLAYEGSQSGLFLQQGAQFGFSSANVATTFDWALMAGYWLYRPDCTQRRHCCLTGIAPQLEFFGKHVMVGSQNEPFEIAIDNPSPSSSPSSSPFFIPAPFREPRNVIDVTAGARVLFWDTVSISSGVSFPVTGGDVRRTEYMFNVTWLF